MINVLLADPLDPQSVQALRHHPLLQLYISANLTETLALLPQAEILVVRSKTRVTAEILSMAPRLKLIVRAGSGIDNIDAEAAARAGVTVKNAAAANANAVAELVVGLLVSWYRRLPQAFQSTRAGEWNKENFLGEELSGKTISIIGLGAVGASLASKCEALGLRVQGYDPLSANCMKTIDEALQGAHVLSLHVPFLAQTQNLIGARELKLLKPGAVVVNASRGETLNETDLLEALDSGQIQGALLDVLSKEPPPGHHPLVNHPRVWVTPHLGAATVEAQSRVGAHVVHAINQYAGGK